jgi:hypothetical protein
VLLSGGAKTFASEKLDLPKPNGNIVTQTLSFVA